MIRKLLISFAIISIIISPELFAERKILDPEPKVDRNCEVLAGKVRVRFDRGVSDERIEAILAERGAAASGTLLPKELSLTEELKNSRNFIIAAPDKYSKILKAEDPLLRTYYVEFDSDKIPEKFCADLLKLFPEVEIAEPIVLDRPLWTPNDPLVGDQSDMLEQIEAFEAWDVFKGNESVTIGVSDMGVYQYHEDLLPAIAVNEGESEFPNDKDDDNNGFVDDRIGCNLAYPYGDGGGGDTYHSSSHGTLAAGICGAATDNGLGIAAPAGRCKIFPMKCAYSGGGFIEFGYESLIYAALRGFDAVNCSWGTPKRYSEIDQSVIDFAIAHDVAIVVSGGNSGGGKYARSYPANYKGVLGVGETDHYDVIASGSSIGPGVRIFAPGHKNLTTNNSGSYTTNGVTGTSFSSPIVAGVVGTIRALHPELSAVQSLEFARQCVDDLSDKNAGMRRMIFGRINLRKAVTLDPSTIPSLVPERFIYKNAENIETKRFEVGEEVSIYIDLKNYLAAANNLEFTLIEAEDLFETVEITQDEALLASAPAGGNSTIGPFKIRITDRNTDEVFFRVEISGENAYSDAFLFSFRPTYRMTTFGEYGLEFSIGDVGTLGYGQENENPIGVGLDYGEFGNQIWQGALIATSNYTKAATAIYGSGTDESDFESLKGFVPPDENVGVCVNQAGASNDRIGLEITQEIDFPVPNKAVARIDMTVKNVAGGDLSDVGVGYYMDWDLTDSDSNQVALFPEAIPEKYAENPAAAAMIIRSTRPDYPVMAIATATDEAESAAQAYGSDYDDWYHTTSDLIEALTSGVQFIDGDIGDVNAVSGTLFRSLAPDEEKRCFICFGGVETREELAKAISECLDPSTISVEAIASDDEFTLYPIPAKNRLFVKVSESERIESIEIRDAFGSIPAESSGANSIDVSGLSSGVYFAVIYADGKLYVKKFVVSR